MNKVVNGYQLVSDFTTAGGGQCRWTFGERDGREYFIKEFLSPTYPLPESPGSPATKARKLAKCRQFEERHRRMMTSLARVSRTGGNLVVASDFFRSGARYYKVTAKVDVSTIGLDQIRTLPRRSQTILATTVAHSLQILHGLNLVHGDIKPPNVLLKRTVKGLYAAKLIDFDDSYPSRRPPVAGELVGDITYYSPETQRYVLDDGPADALTTAADIFSLGILLTEYLTGSRPAAPDGMTCATAVLTGAAFRTGLESGWPAMDGLIRRMLDPDAAARPSIGTVIQSLKEIRDGGTGLPHTEPPAPEPTPTPAVPSRLVGKGLDIAKPSAPGSDTKPSGTPYLRGDLIKKR